MTSVVDKYYRRIIQNIDNVKMKFDISSLLVKSKEHDSKIDTNVSDISDNLGKIETNETNISSNLSKISNNETNISSNLTKISNNETNISSNLSKISNNESNISSNLSKISNNESNISSNLTKINTNVSDISSNLTKINTNISDISSNLELINTNKNSITNLNNDLTNLNNGYKLKDIIVFTIRNTISQSVSQTNPSFVIFTGTINNNLNKDSYIQLSTSIYLAFLLHYINIQFFYLLLRVLDNQNQLITSIKMPLIGTISKHCILTNVCYIKIPNDYNSINLELSIKIQEGQNRSDIVKILDFDNYVYCKIFEKLNTSIVYVDDFDV